MQEKALMTLGLVTAMIEDAKQKGEPEPEISLKGESKETLIEVLDWAMSDLTVTNPSVLFNVRHLITPYNTMDESFFQSKEVWFTDIEQMLDVKIALSKQIKALQVQVVKAWLMCLRSLHKVEFTYLDSTAEVAPAVRVLLAWMTVVDLSKLFDAMPAESVMPESKVYIKDAMGILAPMVLNASAMFGMVNLWSEGLDHADKPSA